MDIKSEISTEVVFGPLYKFIIDNTIEEIWINSPERIFIARNGVSELSNVLMTSTEVQELVDRALIWSGRRLDLSSPFVDARLPDGSRLHAAIPEVTETHWAVNIRKHLLKKVEVADLVSRGVMSVEIAEVIIQAISYGLNILISGGTQAGKTTLLSAIASEIPPTERVITIEEVFEIQPQLPDLISLQSRGANMQGDGEITLRRLVKESLRMRPNRLIIGEVREAEALDLIIALNSGLPGMGTIHANSARDAIMKLQTLPLLAGKNISYEFIAPTVASAIDLVIHVEIDREGRRRVTEVLYLTGRCESLIIESEIVWEIQDDRYIEGVGLISLKEILMKKVKKSEN